MALEFKGFAYEPHGDASCACSCHEHGAVAEDPPEEGLGHVDGFDFGDDHFVCMPAEEAVRPLIRAFEGYKDVHLDERCTGLYKNGVKLRCEQAGISREYDRDFCVAGSGGEFLGIARVDAENGVIRAVRNFY